MSRILINRIRDPEQAASLVTEQTGQCLEEIRRQAFHYFEQRGALLGNDLEDWLRAEGKLLWKPHAEMFENDFYLTVRVAVPGFSADDIRVTAAPETLLVQSSETHSHFGLDARLRFCEFGERLFRSFHLTRPIDPAAVSATLDKGILQIVAPLKPRPVKPPGGAPAN